MFGAQYNLTFCIDSSVYVHVYIIHTIKCYTCITVHYTCIIIVYVQYYTVWPL